TKSNTRTNRSAARPTDSHFLIGALLSALTLDTALILTRAAAYLIAPQLAAVKSNCRGATADVDVTAGARSPLLDDRDAPPACAGSQPTNGRRESAVNRMPRGFFGTGIFFTTAWAAVSITWMSFEVSLLTATQRPSGEATAVSGSVPTWIFFTIREDATSMTVTAESFSFTT